METKWKVFRFFSLAYYRLVSFFFSKGSNGMDRSETSTEMIKKHR